MPVISKDDPCFVHYAMGGRAWKRPGSSRIERLYFNTFSVRGGDWWLQPDVWKRQGPAQFPSLTQEQIKYFPEGYFDTESREWVISKQYAHLWTRDAYAQFMNAALKRRTFSPMIPPTEVLTVDGMIMERGLETMFVGGKVLHRHYWDTSKLLGRKMIAWHRFGAWDYVKKNGKPILKRYGDRHLSVLEHTEHSTPLAWGVTPAPGEGPFVILGRSVSAEMSFLFIECPNVSLMTIDGRRLAPVVPPIPEHAPEMPA